MWLKDSEIEFLASTQEFLASTQEQVLTNRADDAHHWRMWQKVWVRHRATRRVFLCANVHTIDGRGERKIRGDAEKRLNFKSSTLRPEFFSPSRDAGQSGQPCSFIRLDVGFCRNAE